MNSVINKIKRNSLALIISVIFFIIPFFWFQPEAMDIGGDGTRLYFYDPIAFLQNVSLYATAPEGKANIDPAKFAYLPYVGLFFLLKYFADSHQVINILNGVKLSVAFLSIYFITKEFLKKKETEGNFFSVEISSILAGIFYVFTTGSEKLIYHWVKALHSHDQVFLNPLIFFLLLRYFLTQDRWYLLCILFISFVFSTNFAMISAPAFFAFYPIAIFFLLTYVILIRKQKIILKDVLLAAALFIGLHSFHLIPESMVLFDSSSVTTSVVKQSGVNYFMAILGLGKASINFLVPPSIPLLRWVSIIAPLTIIFGLLLSRKKRKELLLTGLFFLITFFLVSANITSIGVELYRKLFLIPGFSMFRNFYMQWAYVFVFFYALLFGQSLAIVFGRLKLKYIKSVVVCIPLILVIGFWPFLSGQLVDGVNWGSNGVKTAMIMSPRYEQTLSFIRHLPDEGKILMLPLTDNYMQVIYGTNNAAYVGPSSISFMTHKKSFAGYQNFWPDPIPEEIMRYTREKDYEKLTQIFSLFNIRYIFHNTDPKIYEEKFPNFPNSYMMTSLPKTQNEYKEFIKNFPVKLIYNNGTYEIFELDKKIYRAEVYIPDIIHKGDMVNIIANQGISYQSAFVDNDVCQKNETVLDFCNSEYIQPKIEIVTEKINPTEYKLHVKQSESKMPFLLVFQNSFHPGWKLLFENNNPLNEEKHVLVNKYANGWIISNEDRRGQSIYTLNLVLEIQKYFWYGLWISGITSLIFITLTLRLIFHKLK